MQDEYVELNKNLPSIREFTDIIDTYNGASRRQAHNGQFSWKNDAEQVKFYYLLLGEDVVVWDQEVKINRLQKIALLSSDEEEQHYLFNFFVHSSHSIHLEDGNVFEHNGLVFCNSRGNYRFLMPKGYEGHILQLVVSDKFLKNYVPVKYLQHPMIHGMIYKGDPFPLIIPQPPFYVKAELHKLAEQLRIQGAGIQNKLPMLSLVAGFINIFFKNYLGKSTSGNSDLLLEKQFKKEVKALLSKHVNEPFMGLTFLAQHFNVSTSTFKRLFNKHFQTSPLSYFKAMQLKHARQLLKSGRYGVAHIAYKLGYSSSANFIRSYKQFIGHTPSFDIPKLKN